MKRMKIKTEHAGAKNRGGWWGSRAEAKDLSRLLRRRLDKQIIEQEVIAMCSRDDDPTQHDPDGIADLEDENADLRMVLGASSGELARLRKAIEDFIAWWDSPPYVLDDDDGLRMMVDDLRAALRGEQP